MNPRDILFSLRQQLGDQDLFVLPQKNRLLAYATGFSGSAGTLLVTPQTAMLFVDGRYTLQAKGELDTALFTIMEGSAAAFLRSYRNKGVLVLDPWLHTAEEVESYRAWGFTVRPVSDTLVTSLWKDLPTAPLGPITSFVTDRSFQEKAHLLFKEGLPEGQGFLLCCPEDIAWLLNLRCPDTPMTPIFEGYAVLSYCNEGFRATVVTEARAYPEETPYMFTQELPSLEGCFYDPSKTPYALVGEGMHKASLAPLGLQRAQKTFHEREGMIQAHIQDGVALVTFLQWLETAALSGEHTEFSLAQQLEAFRQKQPGYKGKSFETISAMGKNSAIVHYHPPALGSAPIVPGMYLLDSGGQYEAGTTDVTRTLMLGGHPTQAQKHLYTTVLQAHVHLAGCVFKEGVRGVHLDAAARSFLWQEGLDYQHSTGHGVGCYLSVHEYPPSLSLRDDGLVLQEHMVFSNEPGCYCEGECGVRIESLVLVEKRGALLGLKTMTLVPMDRRLICVEMLSQRARHWIDTYHHDVFETLSPFLTEDVRAWLFLQTCPL